MLRRIWALIMDTVNGYIADSCLSRGASIAYYTIFSVAPLMVIATAIAGFFFGEEAVRGALDDQLRGLIGDQGAATIQDMVRGASDGTSGTIATVVGLVTLLLTASGVFGELQGALNAIWKVEPDADEDTTETVSRLLRAKAASMGLVAATGFILLVSLAVSAGISMVSTWLRGGAPEITLLMSLVNFVISLGIIALLFGAMYKILPDRSLPWRDVAIGAFVTALLFTLGKSLIGWYLGSSNMATTYGAASSVMIVLLWVYYSSQIFLLGAEFTRAYAGLEGSQQQAPVPADPKAADPKAAERKVAAPAPASSIVQPAPLVAREGTLWRVAGVLGVTLAAGREIRHGRRPWLGLFRRSAGG